MLKQPRVRSIINRYISITFKSGGVTYQYTFALTAYTFCSIPFRTFRPVWKVACPFSHTYCFGKNIFCCRSAYCHCFYTPDFISAFILCRTVFPSDARPAACRALDTVLSRNSAVNSCRRSAYLFHLPGFHPSA